MANDIAEQLTRIGHKAELLATRYQTLRQSNAALRQRIEELEEGLRERDRKLEQQAIELEYLKVSSAIAPTSETTEQVRARISNLVREIDACVDDLMRDI